MSWRFIFTEVILRVALLILLAAGGSLPAGAQSLFERLVMPGDLAAPHAKFQADCAKCHENFSQGAQGALCLDCHKEVAQDIAKNEGLHGRSQEVKAAQCNHCHTDHKGRDAPIVIFDFETFDHVATDFPLVGRHKLTPCGDCHEKGKLFRDAPHDCYDCHKSDDVHKGTFGKACADCHATQSWMKVSNFDHSKTGFMLLGAHAETACSGCHEKQSFKGAPKTCIGCHRPDDIHANRFGEDCKSCHRETRWAEVTFDHDTDTEFTLTGSHRNATCNGCHLGNVKLHPAGKECADCHVKDDVHSGALGTRCASCHQTTVWRDTRTFDHGFTDFPLLGLHAVVPCEQCHFDATFQVAKVACVDCHATDDTHKGTLGPRCDTCHTPTGWAFWTFDHDRDTSFRLTGAHAKTSCAGCHRSPTDNPANLPTACVSCHRSRDVHKGTFGANCARCHSTGSWKGARLR